MDFKKKQKGELDLKHFFLRAGAIFIICLMAFIIIADVRIYQRRKGLEAEVSKYEQQIKQLKERNTKLEEEIGNSDNPDYIEKIAREEQDMQKPGENVVSFIMPEGQVKEEVKQNFWNTNNWFGCISAWFKKIF